MASFPLSFSLPGLPLSLRPTHVQQEHLWQTQAFARLTRAKSSCNERSSPAPAGPLGLTCPIATAMKTARKLLRSAACSSATMPASSSTRRSGQRAGGHGHHQRVADIHLLQRCLSTLGKTVGALDQDVPRVEVCMDKVVHKYLEGDRRYSRQRQPSPPQRRQTICRKASKATVSDQGLSTMAEYTKPHCSCHAFRSCPGTGQVHIF